MKFSVITVSYNAAKTIETTIQSVLGQEYADVEYIIIDGGSTDGTQEIIKKYENTISYWVSEKDSGIYDAMNKGVSVASGDYIYFLGADDCLIDSTVISRISKGIYDDTDILSAGVYLVDEELHLERFMSGMHAADKNQFNGLMIPHQGMFVKCEIMKANFFDLTYSIASDYDFFLKCYYNPNIKFQFMDTPVAYYSSGGVSSHNFKSNDEYLAIMRKHHLSNKMIEFVQKKFNTPQKQMIKQILRKTGVMKYLFLLIGAKKHSCEWDFCRWCN